jgi:hypothetical protein
MKREENRFDWSDVWIFLCITSRDGVSLDHIVAVADMLNHAIPTEREVEIAINHLSKAGLVRVENESFILTETGFELHEAVRKEKGGLFTLMKRMEKHINKQDFPILDMLEFKLRPNQLDKVYNTYHKRVEEIRLKSRKRNKLKSQVKSES